jgi:hypothetical protein
MSDPMPAIRNILGMPSIEIVTIEIVTPAPITEHVRHTTLLNGEPWLATVTLPGATANEIADWLDEAPGTGLTVEHTGSDSVVDVIGGLVNFAPEVES